LGTHTSWEAVAAVVPIRRGLDFETFSLSHSPDFIDLINRSWARYKAAGDISLEELNRKYGLKRSRKTGRSIPQSPLRRGKP